METYRVIERGLHEVNLPTATRPNVPFDKPNEELALFAIRVYSYSAIAHIRTIVRGIIALEETRNTPSARVLVRYVFEWAAHAAYVEENLANCIKEDQWPCAFDVVSKFDRANPWIKKHGKKYNANSIQLDAPDAVRLKRWVAAYERFRVAQYGSATVDEAYGYLSEHAHPSGACFLQYREIHGTELSFVQAALVHLPDVDHTLIDWLTLIYKILGLAKEDRVRLGILTVIEEAVNIGRKR